MIKGFLAGMLAAVVLGVMGAYAFVVFGGMPANADSQPSFLESWAAHKSLRASIRREAPAGPNPVPLADGNLMAGLKLYEKNCMVCHGAADGQASNIAVGLFQEAPQLAKEGVEDDPDGKIFWKIKHGIRLTGMPSFSKTLKDDQIWKTTLFLKHMDSLTPAVQKIWEKVPSAGDGGHS
jgi:mono/diheme cytochrome c family protein